MEIQEQTISFREVKNGFRIEGDDYGICHPITNQGTISTLLSNPYLEDDSKVMYILERIDGVVRGRTMLFPSKMMASGEMLSSSAGSGLFVEETARKFAIGLSLVMYGVQHKENNYLLYAGLSKMVLPIYKKLKFSIFSTPLMWQPRNSRFIFQRMGLKGGVLRIATSLTNIFLRPYINIGKLASKHEAKRFSIEQLHTVPHWVDDISLTDGHKYAEYHDHRWMQWVIDNGFSDDPRSSRRFYAVSDIKGNPIAFFLVKENHGSLPERNIEDICFGAIIEWGIMPGASIDEYTLTKLALPFFSNDVDIVEFTSDNLSVVSRMRKYGFIQHGEAHICFKDLTKQLDKDSQQMDNWRIRMGYSDVAFY